MTLGPVMLDVAGCELTIEDKQLLKHPAVGGVILFSRNFFSLEQLEQLVADIHAIKTPPLLVAVDQEGGRVQRFKDGFSILPNLRSIGHLYDSDVDLAKHLAKESAWLMASEIRSTGIDISFSPVLDLDLGISEVIGNRAFHKEATVVASLAKCYVQGMNEAGMQATGKHFPGHGSVDVDSHSGLPIDKRSFNDINHLDLYPFKYMIENNLHALMIAHILFPQVDDEIAGFSSKWLQKILRQQMQFQGVIFSDDLSMSGATINKDHLAVSTCERAQQALEAGCDMILVCNNRQAAREVVESLDDYNNPASGMRLALMRGTLSFTREELVKQQRWINAKKKLKSYIEEPSLDLDL